MKILLSVFLLLICVRVYAEDFNEVLVGSITAHLFNPGGNDYNYSNKLNNSGLIDNPMAGFRQVEVKGISYTSHTFFAGDNSIGQPMAGVSWSVGYAYDGYRLGVLAGVYLQDTQAMLDRNVVPAMIIPYNGVAPCPIIGLEAIKTFPISRNSYFILNGLLTPMFFNGTIGLGWNI